MRVNPDYLMTFSAVAELGSVSKAAEYLNLSQPAVSGQLRALSELLGVPLYTRHARGITLTAAGLELLPQAQTVARAMRRVEEIAASRRDRARPSVRLGVSWTLAPYAVQLVRQFRGSGVTINLRAGHTPKLVAVVAATHLDAALTVDASQKLPEGLEARRFSSEDLRLILPSGHPLAEVGYTHLGVLSAETLLVAMPEANVWRHSARLLNRAGVVPGDVMELGSYLAVKMALFQGLGVAILPRSLVADELACGRLVSVGLEAVDITLGYHTVSAPLNLLPEPVRNVLENLSALDPVTGLG